MNYFNRNLREISRNIWYYRHQYHRSFSIFGGDYEALPFCAIILSVALSNLAFGEINEPMTAKEWYEQYGQGEVIGGGILAASTPRHSVGQRT